MRVDTIPILPSRDFDETVMFWTVLGFEESGRWPESYLIVARPGSNSTSSGRNGCQLEPTITEPMCGSIRQVQSMICTRCGPHSTWGMGESQSRRTWTTA